MNKALDILFARRSIRVYADRQIPEPMVRDLLEAGMAAPSAVCRDPWEFVVVRNQETRRRIAEGLPNGQMLPQAAVGIVVCGELERAHDRQISYLLQDCSAAIENILLAAQALGLGACWLGVHPREERVRHLRATLGIPDGIVPVSVIALGWPAENKPPRTRYSPARVHSERWS